MMFGGILCRQNSDDPRGWISPEGLLAKIDPYAVSDTNGHYRAGPVLLGQAIRWNTPQSRLADPPVRCRDTGCTIVGWIRLDNREELCRTLQLAERQSLTDEAIVLTAYRRWDRAAAPRLEGEFAFAIYDPAQNAVWCVRDVMGTRPLFYTTTSNWFAFASTAAAFAAIKGAKAAPSDDWIGRFLLGYSHDHNETALEGVYRLPPAHEMLVRQGTTPEPERYFAFTDPKPGIGEPDEAWVERYRDALDKAVAQSLRSDFPVAAELSGGIDSSAIVASAAAELPEDKPLHTLGLAMFEEDVEAQQAVVNHCHLRHHATLQASTDTWLETTNKRAHAVLGFPLEHANAGMHLPIYEEAVHRGVRTLLSGFGGDEIVSSGARELYREAIDAKRWDILWTAVGTTARNRVRGTAHALRDRSLDPKPSSPAEKVFQAQLTATPLLAEFIRKHALEAFQQDRGAIFQGETPNQTVLGRAFRAYVAGRFESCSAIAASYGIEYRWPLTNRSLIHTFLTTPSVEKHRFGIGRYLHRRAIDGRVPPSIAWHAKSMGPVRAELRPKDGKYALKNIDLLPSRLVSILCLDKYRELGESLKQGPHAKAGFDRSKAHQRELARRIGTVSDWLSTFED